MSDPIKPSSHHEEEEQDDEVADASESVMHTQRLVIIPAAHSSAHRSRSPSPGTSISVEFIINNQMTRLNLLTNLRDMAQQIDPEVSCVDEVTSLIQTIEKQCDKFSTEHDSLGRTSRRTIFSHSYMTERVYEPVFSIYTQSLTTAHRALTKIKRKQGVPSPSTTQQKPAPRKLPELIIPTFNGTYQSWPSFKDLFTSIVIQNEDITDVERMHYLRTNIHGEAAKLISTMPVEADSFQSAWDILNNQYNNKRLLVAAHLDRIIGDNSTIKCNVADLTRLLNSLTVSLNALRALGIDTTNWDPLLVQLITNRLARPLMQSWENKLGVSVEFPTLDQLKEFLWGHTRAQERIESKENSQQSAKPSASNSSRPVHTVSQSKPTLRCQYPCDVCSQDHYIVACPKFAQCTPQRRMKGVISHKLCFNCLGHHNISSCLSKKVCKQCGKKHHTMLHGAQFEQADSATATQSSSTQKEKPATQ